MDAILTILVFLLISGVSAWLKKRGETAEGEPMPPPRGEPGVPSRGERSPLSNWEEELRRLLEGKPAVPPSAPPPILARPVQQEEPAAEDEFAEDESRPLPFETEPMPSVLRTEWEHSSRSVQSTETTSWDDRPLAPLAQAEAAHEKARHLRAKAAAELKKAQEESLRKGLASGRGRTVGPRAEISDTLAMFESPGAARQAIIASVVLGPPRGITPEDPTLFQ